MADLDFFFDPLRMINADRGYEPDSPFEKIHNEAVKLWDAVQTLAESGVADFKRSLRAAPDFT